MTRAHLEQLEAAELDDVLAPLVWLAIDDVPIDAGELKAARRRAMLVLAAGGDPHRELELETPAVERLAAELDSPERRAALTDALARADATGLPRVEKALLTLQNDAELAWRLFALVLVADELADE
jgi:hypothetical protein